MSGRTFSIYLRKSEDRDFAPAASLTGTSHEGRIMKTPHSLLYAAQTTDHIRESQPLNNVPPYGTGLWYFQDKQPDDNHRERFTFDIAAGVPHNPFLSTLEWDWRTHTDDDDDWCENRDYQSTYNIAAATWISPTVVEIQTIGVTANCQNFPCLPGIQFKLNATNGIPLFKGRLTFSSQTILIFDIQVPYTGQHGPHTITLGRTRPW